MVNHRDLLKEHEKYLSKNKDLADAFKELSKQVKEMEEQRSIVIHEFGSPVVSVEMELNRLIKKKDISDEYKEDMRRAKAGIAVIKNIHGLLQMNNLSPQEINKRSDSFSLEDLARQQAVTHDLSMRDKGIGLSLRYDRNDDHSPIEVNTYKPVMEIIWGTLLGNSIKNAPKGTKIRQGIRILDSDELDIVMENLSLPKARKNIGLNKGMGIPFAKKIIEGMGGKISTYNEEQMEKNYRVIEYFGEDIKGSPKEEYPLFGVNIRVPMKSLIAPEKR